MISQKQLRELESPNKILYLKYSIIAYVVKYIFVYIPVCACMHACMHKEDVEDSCVKKMMLVIYPFIFSPSGNTAAYSTLGSLYFC